MQSYNHPAYHRSPQHAASLSVPSSHLPPTRPRFTSMSGPSPHIIPETMITVAQSSIPPSLTPGSRARIWDKTTTQRPRTAGGSPVTSLPSPHFSPQRSSLYGDYFFAQPQASIQLLPPPPLPQKPQALLKPLSNPLPPIPPKPPALAIAPASRIPLYPTSIPLTVNSLPPEPVSPDTLPTLDEKEIKLALLLSASEARKREQQIIAREEQELAKALEESRLLSTTMYTIGEQSLSSSSSRAPSIDRASTFAIKSSTRPPEGESWLHLITPSVSSSSSQYSLHEDPSLSHSSPNDDQSDDDPTDVFESTPTDIYTPPSPTPPSYTNIVPDVPRDPLPTPPSKRLSAAPSSSSTAPSTYLPSEHVPSSDRAPSSPSWSVSQSSISDHLPMPPFPSRPSWSSVSSENGTSGRSLVSEAISASSGYKSPTQSPASLDLSHGSSAKPDSNEQIEEQEDIESGSSIRPLFPLSANHYVERDMLMGICMGFSVPVISTEVLPMAGAVPNVITLPYGKAPVFHFQAPSWRKLLKLMARLSGTRVEPTVEALSVAKHDLKLRTVIQFIKVHHSASEWRTVIYLTTDYPVPPNVSNAHRYTNGDVSVLPYSYGLSPLPPLLRDGSESPMAKYYVVPSTPTTPYPNLPIDFPNLAMYLQSAVRDSRRAAGDGSSGLRKLAQYIDGCYRTETEHVGLIDQEMASKKGGVVFMFKRVMGRNRASKNGGGNDEIYDLVTPFVSDEWG